jgi:hypothetical protein
MLIKYIEDARSNGRQVSKIRSASIFGNKQSKKIVSLFDLKDEPTTFLQNARNCLRVDIA